MWKYALVAVAVAVWASVTLLSLTAFWRVEEVNSGLREQIILLQQIRSLEAQQCEGVYQVNLICEQVVYDFASQLGLDVAGPSTILATGIVQRHEGGMGGGN